MLKSVKCALMLTTAAMFVEPTVVVAQTPTTISEQSLAQTLTEIGRVNGVEVVYSSEIVAGLRAPAISGNLTVEQALERALAGSGLRARRAANGAFVIERVQQSSSAEGQERVDKIIVVGSRVGERVLPSALPVSVITRDDIDAFGFNTVSEVLSTDPSFTSVLAADTRAGGRSTSQLRGLPTLTLLNERRVASSGFVSSAGFSEDFVDLDSIPFAAIERVEVLKGGGSALYGTDAVGGVINYVLRRNFTGVDTSLTGSIAGERDGHVVRPSITAGWSTDRYSVLGALEYRSLGRIRATDRSFSASADQRARGGTDLRGGSAPNNVLQIPSFAFGPGGTCPEGVRNTPNGNPVTQGPADFCIGDQNRHLDLSPQGKGLNGLFTGSLELNPVTLFSEFNYSRTEYESRIPQTVGVQAEDAYNNPLPAQFNAPGTDITILWPGYYISTGDNIYKTEKQSWRGLGGVRGRAGRFNVETTFSHAESTSGYTIRDAFERAKVLRAIETGTINPIDPRLTSAAALDALRVDQSFEGKFQNTMADVLLRGPLFPFMGRNVRASIGGEVRQEKLSATPSAAWQAGEIWGYTGYRAVSASRDIQAAYGELLVPFADRGELQIALRYDNYEGFGNTTNPFLSATIRPLDGLTLRGSWGTGFRAPSLSQANLSGSSNDIATDPLRCNATVGFETSDCLGPFPTTVDSSGLGPEKTKQYNFGIDLQPALWFRLSTDYWNIAYTNKIEFLSAQRILQNESLFPTRVTRAPSSGGVPGAVTQIRTGFINVGRVTTDGIDTSIRLNGGIGPGHASLDVTGTYILSYNDYSESSLYRPLNKTNIAGEYYGTGPRFRLNATAGYEIGKFGFTLQMLYTGSYYVDPLSTVTNSLGADTFRSRNQRIADQSIFNLGMNYSGFKDMTMRFGVRNLLDTAPPFDPNQEYSFGYDIGRASPRGREFFATFGHRF